MPFAQVLYHLPVPYTEENPEYGHVPLELMRAAVCPLTFKPTKLSTHPEYDHQKSEGRVDESLKHLEVGDQLSYVRSFSYSDHHHNPQTGTVTTKATFGLAPEDFNTVAIGLFNEIRWRCERHLMPDDGILELTLPEIAQIARVSCGGGSQKDRLRSRILRVNFLKVMNTAAWDSQEKKRGLKTYSIYDIDFMERIVVPHERIRLAISPTFIKLARSGNTVKFRWDIFDGYRKSPGKQRLYLIADRICWNQLVSPAHVDVDDFAIHQLGYVDTDRQQEHELKKQGKRLAAKDRRDSNRRDGVSEHLQQLEQDGILLPVRDKNWKGKFIRPSTDKRTGATIYLIRWRKGPKLEHKRDGLRLEELEGDPLWKEVQKIRDENGEAPTAKKFRRWEKKFGRQLMLQHIDHVLYLKKKKHQFEESEVAAYVDRLNNNYPAPDGYKPQPELFDVEDDTRADDVADEQLNNKIDTSIRRM